ncbi:MAG: (deoxy)nucleoside triphosphate pyrophosphohydrolase [Bacteroidota bacterium]|nr:(deoxy)nucleoside triphosphate pyrophosphohydrolase [Bacteroidota bacterium]
MKVNQNILVTAAIIENEGKILIAKRKPGKHLEGFWEFPGGKIEPGEKPEEALKREILEELNLEIEVKRHFMDSLYQYEDKTILLMAYFAHATYSLHIISKDHDEVVWVTKEKIMQYIFAPADVPIVKALVEIMNYEL